MASMGTTALGLLPGLSATKLRKNPSHLWSILQLYIVVATPENKNFKPDEKYHILIASTAPSWPVP